MKYNWRLAARMAAVKSRTGDMSSDFVVFRTLRPARLCWLGTQECQICMFFLSFSLPPGFDFAFFVDSLGTSKFIAHKDYDCY